MCSDFGFPRAGKHQHATGGANPRFVGLKMFEGWGGLGFRLCCVSGYKDSHPQKETSPPLGPVKVRRSGNDLLPVRAAPACRCVPHRAAKSKADPAGQRVGTSQLVLNSRGPVKSGVAKSEKKRRPPGGPDFDWADLLRLRVSAFLVEWRSGSGQKALTERARSADDVSLHGV